MPSSRRRRRCSTRHCRTARFEVVGEFALPLFLHTLALFLGRPAGRGGPLVTWGMQALAAETNQASGQHRSERLHRRRSRRGHRRTGDDFFGDLARLDVDGRPLTRDEIRGFANLAFAGGRQTVVYALDEFNPPSRPRAERLASPRRRPDRIPTAIEEFLRFMTPITHLGRTATWTSRSATAVPAGRARLAVFRFSGIATRPRSRTPTSSVSIAPQPARRIRPRAAHLRRRSHGATGVADRVGVRGRPMCVARAGRRSATTPRPDRVRRRAAGLRHAGVALREARLNGSPSATGHWR